MVGRLRCHFGEGNSTHFYWADCVDLYFSQTKYSGYFGRSVKVEMGGEGMRRAISRRKLLHGVCLLTTGTLLSGFSDISRAQFPVAQGAVFAADQALHLLKEANLSLVENHSLDSETERRQPCYATKRGIPLCILITCLDSKISPELLFGFGREKILVIRSGGNVIDSGLLGSIKFAMGQMGTPLVVVMGHENCGVVNAAVSVVRRHAYYSGALGEMIKPILPAVTIAQNKRAGNLLEEAIKSNVHQMVLLLRSALGAEFLVPASESGVKVVGAYHYLASGVVDFFDF